MPSAAAEIVGQAERQNAVFGDQLVFGALVLTDIAPQHPAPSVVALPALPAEMHLAFDQCLPMRLPSALKSLAGALQFQSRMLHGASHGLLPNQT